MTDLAMPGNFATGRFSDSLVPRIPDNANSPLDPDSESYIEVRDKLRDPRLSPRDIAEIMAIPVPQVMGVLFNEHDPQLRQIREHRRAAAEGRSYR